MTATFETHGIGSVEAGEATAEEALLAAARSNGFGLTQFEADTGQLVWAWQRRHDPGPRFLTRRAALVWMQERLGREPSDAA
jgi:hypothetical protein